MTVFHEAQQMSESISQDIFDYLTGLAKQAVLTYLSQAQIDFDLETTPLPIDIRPSAQASFGDYSMPVMAWSRSLKRAPLQIAEGLAAALREQHLPDIQEVSATKPGYVNFRLSRPVAGSQIITRVQDAGADFGRSHQGVGTKVIVEHTNINSNKAAHVG